MKKLTRKSLNDLAEVMPVVNEIQLKEFVGGGTIVNVTVNRSYYGANSTMSYFLATAYDDGNVVASLSGMFLEPGVNYNNCMISGSDTAIKYGTYNVVPSTFHGESGYYEVSGVEGRTGVKIHAGNTGYDTEGCLLPGISGSYNSVTGESTVSNSRDALNELTNFFNEYGGSGITMQISI